MSAGDDPPAARIEPQRSAAGFDWPRLLPFVALLLVGALLWRAWSQRGPRLTLRASAGHGLAAGDELRYRGIAAGVVESVELAPELAEVVVRLRLQRSAAPLARAGSRFWIVRPELGVERASGLETLFGDRYLSVLPGPPGAAEQREFVVLEEPPLSEVEEAGGLEIVLEAPERFGLARGAALSYRGVQVGSLVSVGLASDASSVELRALVRPGYAELVREDTRFWKQSGAEFSLGLTGIELSVDSLQSLWRGGIALATPTQPGPAARTGHRFPLARESEEEWLEWKPSVGLGSELVPAGTVIPELVRVQLAWEQGRLFASSRSRAGWALPVADGLIAPADLLTCPQGSDEDSCALELHGERVVLSGAPDWTKNGLAHRSMAVAGVAAWPNTGLRELGEPQDCLVLVDPFTPSIAISAARLRTSEDGSWQVSSEITFNRSFHGAAVLSRADGGLLGLLLVDEGNGRIASPKGELVGD